MRGIQTSCGVAAATWGMLAIFMVAQARAGVTLNTIALTGTDGPTGPGLGPGIEFSGFGASPTINANGEVAFVGSITGSQRGLWIGNGTSIFSLAKAGTDGSFGPGLGAGVNFFIFGAPSLNDTGDLTFFGRAIGPGVMAGQNGFGIWTTNNSGTNLLAREGTARSFDPGLGPGLVFSAPINTPVFGTPVNNDAGRAAFFGSLNRTFDERGIWIVDEGNSPLAVALEGTDGLLGPGLGAGVAFRSIPSPLVFPLALNASGMVVFFSSIEGPGVMPNVNDRALFTTTGGTPSVLARSGTDGPLGPGFGPNTHFTGFNARFIINDNSDIAFRASVQGIQNGHGIWVAGTSDPSPVAISNTDGPLGPNLGPGVHFSAINPHQFNDNGQIAFASTITGTGVTNNNNRGIWMFDENASSIVARTGTDGLLGPNLGSGVMFNSFGSLALNNNGHVAFWATLTGSDVNSDNNVGFWAVVDGETILVLREGEPIDVDPTPSIDLRTIDGFSFAITPGSKGGNQVFNEDGLLTFELVFTDGSSGIFTASIPETGTAALLGLGFTVLLRRR